MMPRARVSLREALERLVLRLHWPVERPVVFVLGLPRSATLVSRYLVHRLEIAYWTSGVGQHPRAPVVTTFLERRQGPHRSELDSHDGRIEGAAAPREAGSVWERFFDRERYMRFDDLRPGDAPALRNLVAATQRVFGGTPFVNKDVKHMLRIDALARVFPESLFLVVRRRPQDVALSILRARFELRADRCSGVGGRPITSGSPGSGRAGGRSGALAAAAARRGPRRPRAGARGAARLRALLSRARHLARPAAPHARRRRRARQPRRPLRRAPPRPRRRPRAPPALAARRQLPGRASPRTFLSHGACG
jgi:hypothetical protein